MDEILQGLIKNPLAALGGAVVLLAAVVYKLITRKNGHLRAVPTVEQQLQELRWEKCEAHSNRIEELIPLVQLTSSLERRISDLEAQMSIRSSESSNMRVQIERIETTLNGTRARLDEVLEQAEATRLEAKRDFELVYQRINQELGTISKTLADFIRPRRS